jgi:hypothetical protein
MEEKTNQHTLRLLLVLTSLLVLLPSGVAAEPPSPFQAAPCSLNAYTWDDSINHASLLMNGSVVFGSTLFVEHECDSVRIVAGSGQAVLANSSVIAVQVEPGTRAVQFILDHENTTSSILVENLTFLRAGILAQAVFDEAPELDPDARAFTESELISYENWIVFAGSIISGAVATVGLWNFIKMRHDTGYCEEVAR